MHARLTIPDKTLQLRECRNMFMEDHFPSYAKTKEIITISFLANLLVGSFYMSN